MELSVKQEDLFAHSADAVLLTIDGRAPGMEGRLARLFAKRFGESEFLEELESQLDYPLPLGTAALVEIEPGTAGFEHVVVLSVLEHKDALDARTKRAVVVDAFRAGLALCQGVGARSVRTPVLSGGWRLSQDEAFSAMLFAFEGFSRRGTVERVEVCVLENGERLIGIARSRGF